MSTIARTTIAATVAVTAALTVSTGAAYAATGPVTVSDGTYLVGSDIPAGTYRTTGPGGDSLFPMCYWARHRNSDGTLGSIIANHISKGPSVVKVRSSDNNVEFSGGCTWTRAGK